LKEKLSNDYVHGHARHSVQSWKRPAVAGIVVTQRARWVDPVTGAEQGRAGVASQFRVEEGGIVRFQRHDDLPAALTAAGLSMADEVFAR
jgi:hypothetical protein